jgi:peptidyl-prolyl cis-trans isomerase B (cyclophilin B)
MIVFKTNYGDFTIELDFKKAPVSSANFLQYAQSGFYDKTIFHRVIDNFMIQGGGFESGMQQKPTGKHIINEADNGLPNDIGTVAMARTSDPHSATAQFFINVGDNAFLNHKSKTAQGWGYAVFGKVTAGMDVINKIKQCRTTSKSGHQDVPVDEVIVAATVVTLSEGAAQETVASKNSPDTNS